MTDITPALFPDPAVPSSAPIGGGASGDLISPPSPLKFNFSYGAAIPEGAIAAIEAAASKWASVFVDDIVLNIHVDFGDLPGNVLGGARPNMVNVKYRDVLTGMALDQTSQDDATAFSSMEFDWRDTDKLRLYQQGELDKISFAHQSSFSMLINGGFSDGGGAASTSLDSNGNKNNKEIWITSANAKALGLMEQDDSDLDAWIRFNNIASYWDFDRSNGIQSDQYDFQTVALHELGHVLGFISGSDIQSTLMMAASNSFAINSDELAFVSAMDLFRYSDESASQTVVKKYRNAESGRMPEIIVQGVNDWTLGRVDIEGNAIDYYFSLDRGQTKIASLSRGTVGNGADGYQASHWADEDFPLGVMTPNLKPGQSIDVSDFDVKILDVLGWNRRDFAAITPNSSALNLNQGIGQSGPTLDKAVGEVMKNLELDRDRLSDWMAGQRQDIVDQGVAERNRLAQERTDLANWHSNVVNELQQRLTSDLATLEASQSAEQRQIAAQLRQIDADRAAQEAQIQNRLAANLATLAAQQTEVQRHIAQELRQIDSDFATRKAKILQALNDNLVILKRDYLTGLSLSWKDMLDISENLQKQADEQISALTKQTESGRKTLSDQLSKSWADQVKSLQEQAAKSMKDLDKQIQDKKSGLEKQLSKDWQDKIRNLQSKTSEAIVDLGKSLDNKTDTLDQREKDLDSWSVNLKKALVKQMETQLSALTKLEEQQAKKADKLANETDKERADREAEEAKTLAKMQESQNDALLKIAEKQSEELASLSSKIGFDSPLSRSRDSTSTTSVQRYWLSRSRTGSSTSQTMSYWQSIFLS